MSCAAKSLQLFCILSTISLVRRAKAGETNPSKTTPDKRRKPRLLLSFPCTTQTSAALPLTSHQCSGFDASSR